MTTRLSTTRRAGRCLALAALLALAGLTCYQPELNELVGSKGDTLQTQQLIEARLPSDVRARLEWDSEGGMLSVVGGEADVRQVAWLIQTMGPA